MSDNYPSDWDSRRQDVYKRDDYACQNCGRSIRNNSSLELHAHHIVPISKGGSHAKTNLSTMCSQCHGAIHNDQEAPTAHGTPQSADVLTNYQDVFELGQKLSKYVSNDASGHLAVGKDNVGLDQILRYYEAQGESVRRDIHEFKRTLASFDPYDNAESEHVQDDFKSAVAKMIEEYILFLDEVLEIDRLLTRFVEEVTTVECSGCDTVHSETVGFCGECGTELPVLSACPECGKTREATQQGFCHGCGTEMNSFPESRLEQIKTTKQEHKKVKESIDHSAGLVSEIMSEEVLPLWRRELK